MSYELIDRHYGGGGLYEIGDGTKRFSVAMTIGLRESLYCKNLPNTGGSVRISLQYIRIQHALCTHLRNYRSMGRHRAGTGPRKKSMFVQWNNSAGP